jgi:hypothetical protein
MQRRTQLLFTFKELIMQELNFTEVALVAGGNGGGIIHRGIIHLLDDAQSLVQRDLKPENI